MSAVSRAHNLARWATRRSLQGWLLEHPTVGPLLRALPTYWRFPLEVTPTRALVYNPFLNEFAEVRYEAVAPPRDIEVLSIRPMEMEDPCIAEYPVRCYTCGKALCTCPVFLGRSNHDGVDVKSFAVEAKDPLGDSPVLFHNACESDLESPLED